MTEKLSDASVRKALPPSHGQLFLWDSEVKGFGLRITRAGAKSFILDYCADGRQRRITLGSYPDWTVQAARAAAIALASHHTALASPLTNQTVRSDTAMTGEISLRGLVLPVGGIKEKVVAAAAADLTRMMLPARNRRDFDQIPAGARETGVHLARARR